MPTVVGQVQWVGDQASDRPQSVELVCLRNSQEYDRQTVTADDNWRYSWYIQDWSQYTYTVRLASQLENYQTTYEDDTSGTNWNRTYTSTITNTWVAPPEPSEIALTIGVIFTNDFDHREFRPTYAHVTLLQDGAVYDEVWIGEGWNWNWTWQYLDPDHSYEIQADDIPNYDKTITYEGYDARVSYVCNYVEPPQPDPKPGDHPTKEDHDLMYSVLYDDISAENAQDIIHILDYGDHI